MLICFFQVLVCIEYCCPFFMVSPNENDSLFSRPSKETAAETQFVRFGKCGTHISSFKCIQSFLNAEMQSICQCWISQQSLLLKFVNYFALNCAMSSSARRSARTWLIIKMEITTFKFHKPFLQIAGRTIRRCTILIDTSWMFFTAVSTDTPLRNS